MAVGLDVAGFRAIVEPAIRTAFEEFLRDVQTKLGRQRLAAAYRREARRIRDSLDHPRFALPPEVVRDCERMYADTLKRATEIESLSDAEARKKYLA
jgi:hypothetical protein